jgi:serine/threonine protein kinase
MQHRPPFRHKEKPELYSLILECNVQYPAAFSDDFVDLLQHLLVPDPLERFTAPDIKAHRWFKSLVFADILARAIKPPHIPPFTHEGDSLHFDKFAEEEIRSAPEEEYPDLFAGF